MDRSNSNSVVNNFNNSNNSWEEQNNIRSINNHNNNNFNHSNPAPSLLNNQQVKFESNVGENSCREEQSIFRYCEGNLNFATVAADEDDYGFQKKKSLARDPMSHRIIEKRRRDRMNNCLADLSRLIPAEYLKKGRGRVEKTEIIEMAIKHMKHLQAHACNHGPDSCEMNTDGTEQQPQAQQGGPIVLEHYRLGYQECLSETMHFLVEVEGFFAGDSLCVQLINHLQKHCEKIVKGDRLNFPRPHRSEASSSSSRGYSGYSGGPSSTSSGSDSGGNGHSSKENNPGPTDWRRNDVDETPSPIPLTSPHSMTSTMQTLPPPPPPPPTSTNGMLSEQEDSLLSLPSESGEQSSSQLRDMLTGASPSMLPRRNNNNNNNSNAELSDNGSLYKFKNNIKQRFTAEHHHDEKRRRIMIPSPEIKRDCMESPPPPTSGLSLIKQRQSPSPPIIINNNETQSTPNCSSSNSSPITHNYGVPVFALHSKGSFYVPLTIDNDILAPYMGSFSDNHSQVLHPVTISVNFCGVNSTPVHIPLQPAAPMIPWRGDPPGLMPLPKWSVCDRA